ncbi:MAG TPA: carboxypeptidase regulatory-like domain-containing protein [Thermoanaerobaculia bacterium]|jgi:protocatechuate 3,4-dioxygenase beta subunit|nr:carboxypeptidase regulatory-like domain-containing protein [Thermoanaerobaculia bacterium]
MRFRSAIAAVAVVLFAASLSASVTGVVAGPDGAPVANARVTLFRPIPGMLAVREFSRERKPVPMASTVTDHDGRFALDAGGAGLVDVHVLAEGFAPADAVIAADDQVGTIALRRAALVTGRITANGKPVADVFVLAIPIEGIPESAITDSDGRYHLSDPGVWAQMLIVRHPDFAPAAHMGNSLDFVLEQGQAIQGKIVDGNGRPVADGLVDLDDMLTAKSGADGTFTIPHAPKQFGVLRARAGASTATTGFTSGSPVLRLGPGSRISGFVRDTEKRPLAGIAVSVVADVNGETVVTDTNGAFAVGGLKRGKYEVMAYGSSRYMLDPAAADTTLGDVKRDLIARRVTPIEGLVRDEDRKPVSGAAVVLLFGNTGLTDSANLTEFGAPALAPKLTAADGRIRLWQELDPSVKVRIAAIKPGLPPAISELLDPRKPHADMTIARGVEIAGIITGPDKKPLGGVSVNPVLGIGSGPAMGGWPAWATTDDTGHFSGRLTPSTKALIFARKGYVTAQAAIEVSAGMKPLQVALIAGATIRGHVMNKDGSPATEIVIMAGDKFTNSGPDGSFTVDELHAGPVEIQFRQGTAGFQQKTVTAPADDVTLVLAATRTITGHVTDATTGAPVEKFTVSVSASSLPNDLTMPQPFETASGEFTIDAPEGTAGLTVVAEGYAPSKGIAVDAAGNAPMTIKLSHGRTIRGHVTDAKGQPVAGVGLRMSNLFPPEDTEPPQTLADGSFEIRGISFDDDRTLSFGKGGYVSQERKLPAGRDDATLAVTLTSGVTVTGHVLDRAGAPASGVTVSASSAAYGAGTGSARTDESGAFNIDDLSPARYDFNVERNAAGEHGALKDVDIAKTHDLTIRLEKGATATIFGRVTGIDSADPSPYTQRFVSVSSAEGESQMGPVDAGGNYRIENAPAGVVEVVANSASRDGLRKSTKATVEVQPGAELRVDLAFPQQVAVRGHVTHGGAPLAGAMVIYQAESNSTTVSGADGGYQIALDPGEYDVSLSIDRKRLPFAQHVVVNDAAEIDFQVKAATLSTTVFDAETNEPVPNATVTLSLRGETHDLATATTDRDGMASIDVAAGNGPDCGRFEERLRERLG